MDETLSADPPPNFVAVFNAMFAGQALAVSHTDTWSFDSNHLFYIYWAGARSSRQCLCDSASGEIFAAREPVFAKQAEYRL